jgi:hypothetical protein
MQRRAKRGAGRNGCDAAPVGEIVALAGTNKVVIGAVNRWIGPTPLRQHWGFVQTPPQSARADADRIRGIGRAWRN